MTSIVDVIADHFPPVSGTGVPLQSQITIDFNREMDTTRLQEDFFLEGPDTDQFVGPGQAELTHPDNISQGDLDDFLMSPGYTGIVPGTFTFVTVSGVSTQLVFTPTRPLAPSYTYKVHISDTLDADGNDITGMFYWEFETGTGSIEELPSTISTSVLAAAPQAQSLAVDLAPLTVVSTTPENHAIEQETDLAEIIIEFNKPINPSTVSAETITAEALPATDHPKAAVSAAGDLAKSVEVDGKRLKIKI